MKKILMLAIISVMAFAVQAQTVQTEVKVKQTSSPKQKIHNTFSKDKQHNGVKVKGKINGRKYKRIYRKESTDVKTTG